MKEPLTEKELLESFSSVEKMIEEWEALYPSLPLLEPSKEEIPIITEPTFVYKIHSSA